MCSPGCPVSAVGGRRSRASAGVSRAVGGAGRVTCESQAVHELRNRESDDPRVCVCVCVCGAGEICTGYHVRRNVPQVVRSCRGAAVVMGLTEIVGLCRQFGRMGGGLQK